MYTRVEQQDYSSYNDPLHEKHPPALLDYTSSYFKKDELTTFTSLGISK